MTLALPRAASAVAWLPADGRVFTGVAMGSDLADFTRRAGRRPDVSEQFVAWHGR